MRLHRFHSIAHGKCSVSIVKIAAALLLCAGSLHAGSPYSRWTNGPPTDPNFFPLAVWVQNPSRAEEYRNAGINTYVALWRGPTDEQLAALKKAGMKVICHQNQRGLAHRDNPTIIGWMHGDEPDNAQSLGEGKGYGPPIKPEKIIEDYKRIRANDPSRPVFLNLGQGVAYDNYIGRGVRRGRLEDYPEYIKGCDIASFDIYPVVHDKPEIVGNLWYVPRGVERLIKWGNGEKIVWNCIEASRISNTNTKPTAHQVKAEVWMSLIHGSRGIVYFVHQFKPVFREASLLDDPELLAGVTALNKQIAALAPVLNTDTLPNAVTVSTSSTNVPVAIMVKRHQSATYIFAAAMRAGETTAKFSLPKSDREKRIEVIGENRVIAMKDGVFKDNFKTWDTHIYRVAD